MSAFIVSESLINGLLTYRSNDRMSERMWIDENHIYNLKDNKDLNTLANILLTENYKSVNARYRESGNATMTYKTVLTTEKRQPLQAINILKMCSCFDYQACETEDYESSLAYKIIQAIRLNAIHRLPNFDSAEGWG